MAGLVLGSAVHRVRIGGGRARVHARHLNAGPAVQAGVRVHDPGHVSGAHRPADRVLRNNILGHLQGSLALLLVMDPHNAKDLRREEFPRHVKDRPNSVREIVLVGMEQKNLAHDHRDRHLHAMAHLALVLLRHAVGGHLAVLGHPHLAAGLRAVLARRNQEAGLVQGRGRPGVGIQMAQDFLRIETARGEEAGEEVLQAGVAAAVEVGAADAAVQTGIVIAAGGAKDHGAMGLLGSSEMVLHGVSGVMAPHATGAESVIVAGAGETVRPGTIATAPLVDGVDVRRLEMVRAGHGLPARVPVEAGAMNSAQVCSF